ncbi:MAG: tail tape measure protein [Mu-like cryoconite phage AB09]|nr:MAG: tail tape measure protein [Mu-like cryoconite phage AB09]
MAAVKSLVTRWGFEVDLKPLQKMKDSLADLKHGVQILGIEAAAAAASLFIVAETTAKAGKEASLNAQRTGMNVEAFQELSYAAERGGVSAEMFTHSLAHLNRSLFEAKMGNKEAAQGFGMLGRGAIAMKLFGRAGYMMTPMFKNGAAGLEKFSEEAREMGLVMSEAEVNMSKGFMHSLHEVHGLLTGMKRTIGVALLEPMTKVFESFSTWIRLNRAIIRQNITEFFEGLATVLGKVMKVSSIVMQRISGMVKPLGGLGAAAKYAFEALALFAGGKILIAIGGLAQSGFAVLTTAVKVFRGELLLTEAAAFLVPLAIGVAVLAVIAIIEDLIGFFQGKDSVTGRLLAMFQESMPEAFGLMKGLFNGLIDMVKSLWTILQPVAEWFGKTLLESLKDTLKAITGIFGVMASGFKLVDKGIGIAKDFAVNSLGIGGDSSPSSMLGVIPGQNDMPGGGGSNPVQNVNVTTTVTVPTGTDAHMVGDRVEDGISKALDPHIRQANRSFAPVVGH